MRLNDSVGNDLINEISSNDILDGDLTGLLISLIHFKNLLDYQAPRKKNQAPFLAKNNNKEIMTRSKLRNKLLRCGSAENRKAHNEQRDRCVKLVTRAKSQKKLIIAILALTKLMKIKHFGK